MPVEYLEDGAEAVVRIDGRRHRYDVEEKKVQDLESYSYQGPEDEEPDDVQEELEDHVDEVFPNEPEPPEPAIEAIGDVDGDEGHGEGE